MLDKQDAPMRKRTSNPINGSKMQSCDVTATSANKLMTKILASLSPREEMLLRLRFGIGTEVAYPLSQLSRRFSLPPQRLGRIQQNAFTKLRRGATSCPKFERILVLPSADGSLAKAGDPTSIRLTN
jgi:sigma-70-like protein